MDIKKALLVKYLRELLTITAGFELTFQSCIMKTVKVKGGHNS